MTDEELDALILSAFTPYDRALSLQIDAVHDELDRLCGKRGVVAWVQRLWWRWQLRQLEARIPQ